MRLELRRFLRTESATVGVLSVNGVHECFVLEDPVRAAGVKVYGNTAIPAGEYRVIVSMSTWFKKELPLLLDVPNFDGIRIHSGNKTSETEGCLLPGVDWMLLERTGSIEVHESRVAQAALQRKIAVAIAAGDEVRIRIINLNEE